MQSEGSNKFSIFPENFYLKLSKPLRFEAVNRARLNNVFYDECNNQVFSVQSTETTEVAVKCPDKEPRTFKMQEKGSVISIKFNPAQNILAVQRTSSSVGFINFQNDEQCPEYTQHCKSKSANILGFIWSSATDIIYITDQGVETYQIDPAKCTAKSGKSIAMNVNWFVFCRRTHLLLLSSGALGTTIQPVYINQGQLQKLNRFEIELSSAANKSQKLEERDILMGIIYKHPRVLVLRHHSPKNNQSAEVIIYTIKKMSTVKKTNVLQLGRSGRFAISMIDSLIFVHHQASKTSLMFDIGLEAEFDGSIYYHNPVVPPLPIYGDAPELYSSNWIMFPLNTVIDIKVGCLWCLELELEHIDKVMQNKVMLVEFLMLRNNSKEIILRVLREATQNNDQDLEELATVFDKINAAYRNHLLNTMKWELGSPVSGGGSEVRSLVVESHIPARVVIDQSDMYTDVLSKLADNIDEGSDTRKRKRATWVLLEYIRSLTDHHVPPQHFMHELLINTLVLHKAYYQLHQLLQYYVVSDSKPLACLLLSLQSLYPAAHQLALDMLQRISNAEQEITEVLLSKQQILQALRYAMEMGHEDQLSERKFLEVAQLSGQKQVFYAVAAYFQARNSSVNPSTSVVPYI